MELLLFLPRLVYWIFIWPIWWIAEYLASYFYPLEGEAGSFSLSLLFFMILSVTIIAGGYYLL